MGGSTKEDLDLLEKKIKFTLRPLINAINTSGMNRERRIQLDALLLEISSLQKTLEVRVEKEGSTENKIRLTGLLDSLHPLLKGAGIQVSLPEHRRKPEDVSAQEEQKAEEGSRSGQIRILSLNTGGMRLHSPTSIKVGSVFRTQLKSSRYGVIPLQGEVVWSKRDEKGEGHIVGVHFSPMDEDKLSFLKSYLDKRGQP